MGLASKLASAQGGGAAGYPPQGQQQPPQQLRPGGGGSYPGQQPYQAYPGSEALVTPYSEIDSMAGRPPYQNFPPGPGYPQTPPYPSGTPQPPYNPQQQYGQPQYGQQPYNRAGPTPPGYQNPPYQQVPTAQNPYQRPPEPQQPYGSYPPYQQPQYSQAQYHRPQYGPPQQYQQGPGYGAQLPYQQATGYGYGQQQPPPGQSYPPQQGYHPHGQPPVAGGRPGAPGAPASANPQAYKQLLIQQIREKQLEAFYPPNAPVLDHLAQKAAAQIGGLCQHWRISPEIGNDLCKLALYDIIIYIDDSGSMQFEENGERIDDLRLILTRVASVSTMFDEDGVQVRFMNTNLDPNSLDGIRSEQQIDQLMRNVSFKGLTPMGTSLRQKVIDGIVIPKLQARRYNKPILVITITDGQPAGEPQNAIHDTIQFAVEQVSRQFGRGAIAFQFAQVGNDLKAREFLSKLDEDPVVGQMIDCTSNFENESDEMRRQGVDLTPELWMVKLLLGAIDSSYDRKDERPGAAGGPPGGYRGPPGGYGGPPGYGAPPGGQQYGRPPQGGPGGYPPQGGAGYGGQPQGYGQAPAPPRY